MSGLARVLAGEVAGGVYTWTSAAEAGDVQDATVASRWRFVLLDTWQVDSKAAFMAACRRGFEFPAWVGSNFDAMADALSDVRGGGAEGVLVLWQGWQPLAAKHPHVFAMALRVFAERDLFAAGGRFVVLLQSAIRPDGDVPELEPLSGWSN